MSRPFAVPAVALALVLAGCGSRGDLTPPPGQNLPAAPYGRTDRPTAVELLTRTPQAAPGRSVELRRRSEEREDDPFDLPPEEPGQGPAVQPPSTPTGECRDVADRGALARLARCSRKSDSASG